jgi:menaquinol-cytochrome c reductase iron-sulfur subunit
MNKFIEKISRKTFLLKLSMGMAGMAAAVAAIPVVGALLAPILQAKKEVWESVGALASFPIGSTTLVTFTNAQPRPDAGVTAQSGAWLRRNNEKEFIAFATNCTHLGCPVRWEETAQLFMCPCHGGVYYKDGKVAAGPPPKPLTRYEVRINGNAVQLLTAPLPITNLFNS